MVSDIGLLITLPDAVRAAAFAIGLLSSVIVTSSGDTAHKNVTGTESCNFPTDSCTFPTTKKQHGLSF